MCQTNSRQEKTKNTVKINDFSLALSASIYTFLRETYFCGRSEISDDEAKSSATRIESKFFCI